MTKSWPGRKRTLQYVGLFDFDALYAAVIDWAKNYGYLWQETTYKHKVPSPTGAEQEMNWELTQEVSEILSYKTKITVHIWDMLEVQVEENGHKKSLTSGRIYIWLEPSMTMDWQGKFKNKFAKFLEKWYYVLTDKEITSLYWDTLHYRTEDIYNLLKKFFDLQTKKYSYKGYLGEN